MAGTLHIFRREVVNGPVLYQINYTEDRHTYARVFESEGALEEFLAANLALTPNLVRDLWRGLRSGSATLEGVTLSYHEAKGMTEAPSDF